MDVRGMVVVGTETVLACPVQMAPQVIVQISLNTALYHDARRHFGTSALFTLRPDALPVDELRPAADGRPRLAEFPAELFFGHFAQGGDSLGAVVVSVERTQAFRYARPATALGYLLFGRGPDLFLAHETAGASDFGQIVAVQGPQPPAGQAVHLTVPGRKNSLDSRLTPGEQVRASATSPPATLDLQVLAEVYTSEPA